MKRLRTWTYWIAWLALAVNGPRYVLVYLGVDSLELPSAIEMWMLIVTGIATAIVLTGGNIVIASMISKTHGWTRLGLALAWVLQLVFAVILIAPMLVQGLRATPLNQVIAGSWQLVWAITAVGAVELVAAATMAGYVATGSRATSTTSEASNRWFDLAYQVASNYTSASSQEVHTDPEPVATTSEPVAPDLEVANIDPCPYCGRDGFESVYQRGGHMGKCKRNGRVKEKVEA